MALSFSRDISAMLWGQNQGLHQGGLQYLPDTDKGFGSPCNALGLLLVCEAVKGL